MSFFEIFNPGERYMREEQDRRKMLVSKPTHGGGAPLGIDLDGGKATITIRTAPSPESDPTPAEEQDPTEEQGLSAEHPPEGLEASGDVSATDTPEADENPDSGLSSR